MSDKQEHVQLTEFMTNSVREEIESNMKLITGRPAPEVHWFDAQHNEITIDNKRFKVIKELFR